MRVDGRKIDHAKLEEIRFEAVRRVQAGEAPTTVARDMGLYTNRIFIWLAAYRSGGWDALRARKAMGRPKRLNAKQMRWIYDAVTLKNPLQLKLPFALWTRAQIRTLIARRFSVKLSLVSVGRLLAQLGLSGQKPLFRAYQQDASLVARWLKEEYPKIRAEARRAKAEIFFEDESGVRSDFPSGTTWAKKGETPVVRVTGARFALNRISAVSPRGELRFMVVRGGVGARVFIEFLKRLVQGSQRKIFLICDGHPSHRAKRVTTFVASLKGKLRLFFLPPYSPELNPDELVWNDVKNNGVARTLVHGPRDLLRALISRLRHLQKTPEMVRSFFRHPETRYAAQL
ncbi:IS630 family transposase [Acidiferrobacter sp. SPIII_3]|jgi:transposase|uniref:IS630 family transposase n=1 Tax=Acidiferrobacter sp. SPIII_3 TaxID=1281578 RepID=UPI000D736AA8|nr:IS630 family transposase [Acidiferrobacter sp. SPIII_3]AWP24489.1 IS630 family transposase [Acidiferrobacter sp. SPIII_3]